VELPKELDKFALLMLGTAHTAGNNTILHFQSGQPLGLISEFMFLQEKKNPQNQEPW
jgi:hypothetical protein